MSWRLASSASRRRPSAPTAKAVLVAPSPFQHSRRFRWRFAVRHPCLRAWQGKHSTRRAGLPPVRFHDLRYSYASQLIRQGVPLKTVSALMGHSGISITADTYGHLLGGEEQEEAAKLDAALLRAMEGS